MKFIGAFISVWQMDLMTSRDMPYDRVEKRRNTWTWARSWKLSKGRMPLFTKLPIKRIMQPIDAELWFSSSRSDSTDPSTRAEMALLSLET